jgi:dipeptidase D
MDQKVQLFKLIEEMNAVYKAEYSSTDPNLMVMIEDATKPSNVLDSSFVSLLVKLIYACPNGIYRMSPDIDGLVQTSNNIARVLVKDGTYTIQCLTRSSVNSEKIDLADAIKNTFSILGATITNGGSYPGWMPNPHASIVKIMSELYAKLHNNEKPLVNACHAGLECGILGTFYPTMEMISFGPTIQGAHSPDERVSVSSVKKFWHYLLETLKEIPVKK